MLPVTVEDRSFRRRFLGRVFPVALVLAAFLICVLPLAAASWSGRVLTVVDGDTLIVRRGDGTREKIRLFGVDCPESAAKGRWKAQPYSRRAREFVRELFRDEACADVAIWEIGDSFGRIVAGVIILKNGVSVQEELVGAGLAWVDPKYCRRSLRECCNWMALEKEAARARRGLWKDLDGPKKPVAPWQWRKGEADE